MFSPPISLLGNYIANNGDYRVVINTMLALQDNSIEGTGMFGNERAFAAMYVFYDNADSITDFESAYTEMCRFIDGGKMQQSTEKPTVKLYDWEHDELAIAGAISAVAGFAVMEQKYLHWWSFLAYFNQIGEGAFATRIGIRSKLAKGKRLEKWEREALRDNPDIRLAPELSAQEQGDIARLMKGE